MPAKDRSIIVRGWKRFNTIKGYKPAKPHGRLWIGAEISFSKIFTQDFYCSENEFSLKGAYIEGFQVTSECLNTSDWDDVIVENNEWDEMRDFFLGNYYQTNWHIDYFKGDPTFSRKDIYEWMYINLMYRK